MNLSRNEFIHINDFIYDLNTTPGIKEVRQACLQALRSIIPFDVGTFYLGEANHQPELCDPVTLHADMKLLTEYEKFKEHDYAKWLFQDDRSIVYKDTQLIDDRLRRKTTFYTEFLSPLSAEFGLGISSVYQGEFQGALTLFRSKSSGDFSDKELWLLKQLEPHITFRIFSEQSKLQEINYKFLAERFHLTNREVEIIQLIVNGLSSKQISRHLSISYHTVSTHIKNIYRKIGVSNRSQLVNKTLTTSVY